MECQWQSENDFWTIQNGYQVQLSITSADTWKLITAGIELLKLIKLLFQNLSQKWLFRTYFKNVMLSNI